jgi:peroxin-5
MIIYYGIDLVQHSVILGKVSDSKIDEEAIQSYHRALNLNPNFVRGRYNLGVSCMNMGCFKEAAEHFISALSQHVVNGNASNTNISKTLWDTLHRNFVLVWYIN